MTVRRRVALVLAALVGAAAGVVVAGGPAWASTSEALAIAMGPSAQVSRVLREAGTANNAAVTANAYNVGATGGDTSAQRWTLELVHQSGEYWSTT